MNLMEVLQQAGFKGEALRQAWAIAMRESGGRADAFNGNAGTGDKSYGLFQINMLGNLGPQRLKALGLSSEKDLLDPLVNAKAAYKMSNGGKNWNSWDIDKNGYAGGQADHVRRYQEWYAKFPGAKGGGPDVGGTAAKTKTTDSGAIAPDKLNKRQLASSYGYALKVIYSNPELRDLFQQAFGKGKGGQWTAERFSAEIQNTKWYQENNSYARTAWAAEMLGGADWEAQQQTARMRVQQQATADGAQLSPEDLDKLTHRYIYEGWGQAGREGLMQTALAEYMGTGPDGQMMGAAGNLQAQLATVALRNGVKLSPDYFKAAARSVESSLTTVEDQEREIRAMAASKWPTFSEKILAGADVQDLASGYINTMAQVFEIDPNSISIDDPSIRKAMTGISPTGEPAQMGLWDFELSLRNDPRWMKTKQATDQIAGIGHDLLRTFGIMGS